MATSQRHLLGLLLGWLSEEAKAMSTWERIRLAGAILRSLFGLRHVPAESASLSDKQITRTHEDLSQAINRKAGKPRPDPAPAMEWLRAHGKEYGGQWVALDGSRLIAHGPDHKNVHAEAEADGAYLPMITYIEPADALPFVY